MKPHQWVLYIRGLGVPCALLTMVRQRAGQRPAGVVSHFKVAVWERVVITAQFPSSCAQRAGTSTYTGYLTSPSTETRTWWLCAFSQMCQSHSHSRNPIWAQSIDDARSMVHTGIFLILPQSTLTTCYFSRYAGLNGVSVSAGWTRLECGNVPSIVCPTAASLWAQKRAEEGMTGVTEWEEDSKR